jgi:DNA-binding response OmpR family regulator
VELLARRMRLRKGAFMGGAAQPQVLVADDDPLLRAIVEHKLAAAGYRVAVAADGRAALEQARRLQPQAIVLDAMMPVVDGFEALRRLKAEPGLRDIAVIMLTAIKRDEDIISALQLGAADYVVKPFNPDELAVRLMRLVPRPEPVR